MKRKILGLLGVLVVVFAGVTVMAPEPAMAVEEEPAAEISSCGGGSFMGFRPWYQGLSCSSTTVDGETKWKIDEPNGEEELKKFIWTIALNILFDLTIAVSYLAAAFVVWGGFQYVMSDGDPGKATKAKTTLSSAIVGTIIAMVASVGVNTVTTILGIDPAAGWSEQGWTAARVWDLLEYAYMIAGIVAVIFIIKGGFEYLTSQGDPGKTRKATQSIIYAVVGLVIVILAAVITSFVITRVGGAI